MLGEVEVLGNSPIARTGVPCIFDDDPVVRLPVFDPEPTLCTPDRPYRSSSSSSSSLTLTLRLSFPLTSFHLALMTHLPGLQPNSMVVVATPLALVVDCSGLMSSPAFDFLNDQWTTAPTTGVPLAFRTVALNVNDWSHSTGPRGPLMASERAAGSSRMSCRRRPSRQRCR